MTTCYELDLNKEKCDFMTKTCKQYDDGFLKVLPKRKPLLEAVAANKVNIIF